MKKLTLNDIKKILDARYWNCCHRFGQKAFWYSDWEPVDIDGETFYARVLQSYATKVGVEVSNLKMSCTYEIGKYSRTTSKQITQYINQIAGTYHREYIEPDFEYRRRYA